MLPIPITLAVNRKNYNLLDIHSTSFICSKLKSKRFVRSFLRANNSQRSKKHFLDSVTILCIPRMHYI